MSIIGPVATAQEVPPPPVLRSMDATASIANWLIDAPGQHPVSSQWALCVTHLRDIDGQRRPPHIARTRASHEVILLALNPTAGRNTPKNLYTLQASAKQKGVPWWFTPACVCHQVLELTDTQAKELARVLCLAIAKGILPVEPEGKTIMDSTGQAVAASAWWVLMIESIAEEIRQGQRSRVEDAPVP